MDDLIRRQDVLDAVKKLYVFAPPLLINTILSVPSASTDMSSYSDKLWHLAHERGIREAQQQWIPCSERLPEKFGDYLVSVKRHGWNCEEHIENDIAYWDDLEGFHKAEEVLAWMSLPEPYKGENAND